MRKTIFRVYTFLFVGSALLPIIFSNLPFPFHSPRLWLYGLIPVILFTNFKVLIDRQLFPLYLIISVALLFYFFAPQDIVIETITETRTIATLYQQFLFGFIHLLFVLLIYKYFIITGDFKGLEMVSKFALICLIITSLTSIISYTIFPSAIRLAEYKLVGSEKEIIGFYQSIGIAGYDFFYGMAFLIPLVVFYLRQIVSTLMYKILGVFLIAIMYYAIIKANLATAFLIFTISLIISAIGHSFIMRHKKKVAIIAVAFFLIPTEFYTNTLSYIIPTFEKEKALQIRISDLSTTLEGEEDTHSYQRLERIPFLLDQIGKNFLTGGGRPTGHVFWLDLFAIYGIFMIILVIWFFYSQMKSNFRILPNDIRFYYGVMMFSFIIQGFVKNTGGISVWLTIFLIGPGIGIMYTKRLKQKSSKEEQENQVNQENFTSQ